MIVGELIAIVGTALWTRLTLATSDLAWAASWTRLTLATSDLAWAALLVVTGIGMGMAMQLPYTALQLVLQ